MFEKLHTKTLWIIAVVSGMCFLLSPILATPIGNLADSILLERFQAAWSASHDPSLAWQSLRSSENIFAAATITIALLSLICGSCAVWTLYRRHKNQV